MFQSSFFLFRLTNMTFMKMGVGEVRKLNTAWIFYNFVLIRAELGKENGHKNWSSGSEFRENPWNESHNSPIKRN